MTENVTTSVYLRIIAECLCRRTLVAGRVGQLLEVSSSISSLVIETNDLSAERLAKRNSAAALGSPAFAKRQRVFLRIKEQLPPSITVGNAAFPPPYFDCADTGPTALAVGPFFQKWAVSALIKADNCVVIG
jgi:hypothetical protein